MNPASSIRFSSGIIKKHGPPLAPLNSGFGGNSVLCGQYQLAESRQSAMWLSDEESRDYRTPLQIVRATTTVDKSTGSKPQKTGSNSSLRNTLHRRGCVKEQSCNDPDVDRIFQGFRRCEMVLQERSDWR